MFSNRRTSRKPRNQGINYRDTSLNPLISLTYQRPPVSDKPQITINVNVPPDIENLILGGNAGLHKIIIFDRYTTPDEVFKILEKRGYKCLSGWRARRAYQKGRTYSNGLLVIFDPVGPFSPAVRIILKGEDLQRIPEFYSFQISEIEVALDFFPFSEALYNFFLSHVFVRHSQKGIYISGAKGEFKKWRRSLNINPDKHTIYWDNPRENSKAMKMYKRDGFLRLETTLNYPYIQRKDLSPETMSLFHLSHLMELRSPDIEGIKRSSKAKRILWSIKDGDPVQEIALRARDHLGQNYLRHFVMLPEVANTIYRLVKKL